MREKKLKVLLCERNFAGHRKIYFSYLKQIKNIDIYSYCPEKLDNESFFCKYDEKNNLLGYVKWILNIKKIVEDNKIDVVHILDGDSIMKYFGFLLNLIKCKKIIVTYHHLFSGKIRRISYKMMLKAKNRMAVVHTENVKKSLEKIINKEVQLCYYPSFDFDKIEKIDVLTAKNIWNCPVDIPTIGIIGGMCKYKNIIRFLNAVNEIDYEKINFHILICGKCVDITEKEIVEAIKSYKNHTTVLLRKLSDDEYQTAIVASDIIFNIYGKEFDGASGPMLDGIVAQKMILGCKHGSTGEIVEKNELGLISDCEDNDDIRNITENSLKMYSKFKYNELAENFKNELIPLNFQKKYNEIYKK